MSYTGTATAAAPITVERLAARRSKFYVGISSVLLLIVLVGFRERSTCVRCSMFPTF